MPLAAQNALFCIHAATNIEELQYVQIGGYRAVAAACDCDAVLQPIRIVSDLIAN